MRDIAFTFFLAAVLCVIGGMVLGLWLGMTENFQFGTVHAHLNVVGWVTMALFGIYYRLTPQAAIGWLPRIHAVLAIGGVAVFIPGMALALTGGSIAAVVVGALLTVISMLVFLFTVLRHGFGAAPSREGRPAAEMAMTPAE